MKNKWLSTILVLLISTPLFAQQKIEWMSFEQAIEKNSKGLKKDRKMIFVDVYTDWCGWCKKMDQSTFSDSAVIKIMNAHFLAVKLNAEQSDTIKYKDEVFVNPSPGTPRSTHQLAISLLQGQMSYPSFVILNADEELTQILKGYRAATEFEPILRYFGEGIYLTKSWEEFQKDK